MCKVIVPTFMLQFGWRKNAKDTTDVIRPVMQFECPACGRCGLTHVTCDDVCTACLAQFEVFAVELSGAATEAPRRGTVDLRKSSRVLS